MAIISSTICLILAVTAVLLHPGHSRPGGAPSGACINLTPSSGSHGAGQTSPTPYVLNFAPELNETVYTPGQTYTVTLSGNNSEQFRGFLVQVRSSPGDAILGGIAENSVDVQPHACTPSDGGVTHTTTSSTDKPSISFQWTPTAGTGDVVFRYTVVQTRFMHWDAASTVTFQEQVVPTDPSASTGIAPSVAGVSSTAAPQVVMTSFQASTPAPTNLPTQTMCSGRISLGRWSAVWTVRGEYVTFIVSGSVSQSSTGAYLAIGFSDSRSMPNSDIIVGGSDGSTSFVSDRYAASRSAPPSDSSQDVTNTSVVLNNELISYTFTRRLNTGDTERDIVLGVRDTMCRYILFASGSVSNIATQSIDFHGSRTALSSEQVCLCSSVGWRATSFSVLVLLIIAAMHCLL